MFEDEFGVSFSEPVGFTWARRGQTPLLKRIGRYRREVSTLAGKIYKRHFTGSINSEKVIVGLENLRQHMRKPFILIWDRSQSHRSKIVKQYLHDHPEIHVGFLPAYAPDLNPEEYCHGNVKRRIKNAVFLSTDQIRRDLDRGLARLRKRPDILLSCFHHAGLTIN